MRTSTWVEVWDQRYPDRKKAIIGVNWSAVGPVTPNRARKFAMQVFRAAKKAEQRIQALELKKYKVSSSAR